MQSFLQNRWILSLSNSIKQVLSKIFSRPKYLSFRHIAVYWYWRIGLYVESPSLFQVGDFSSWRIQIKIRTTKSKFLDLFVICPLTSLALPILRSRISWWRHIHFVDDYTRNKDFSTPWIRFLCKYLWQLGTEGRGAPDSVFL